MRSIFSRIPASPNLRPLARNVRIRLSPLLLAVSVSMVAGGCTGFREYVDNGFKVGPNYEKPPAPVASEWIDSKSRPSAWSVALAAGGPVASEWTGSMFSGVNVATADLRGWWKAFNDPTLDALIEQAYQENLTLRSAGTRILASRAQTNIALGFLLPQQQQAFADYSHRQFSRNTALSSDVGNPAGLRTAGNWLVGANLSWEVDFWGRFRRGVEAANAELDASVENYDDALVLLLSEVASTYVQIRVTQQRLQYVAKNIGYQTKFRQQAEERLLGGVGRLIDQAQQRSNLSDTLALKEQLEISLRQANNRLCVLLGEPVRDLLPELGNGGIPGRHMVPELAIGMPADLLRRRPDLRRAERQVAAQSARIGVATSDLYPHIALLGTIGYDAETFSEMFSPGSFLGRIGPSLRWDILNYGRLLNGIRVQDALFQTAAVDYQNAVLQAGREVEDSVVLFLRSQAQARQLADSADQANIAVDEALKLSTNVMFDLNQAFVTSNFLVAQEDKLAQARGNIALGFIQIYKALGGGWEIRLPAPATTPESPAAPPERKMPDVLPEAVRTDGSAKDASVRTTTPDGAARP
jgi:NodT family efflux transporter outer membrane factor (OMF) lipoprotein